MPIKFLNRNIINLFLIFLFNFFISLNFGHTRSFYVSLKGKNTNTGSFKNPFYSIQFASNKLKPGDTLFIRGGVYTENCNLKIFGTKENRIFIQNFKKERVELKTRSYNLIWKPFKKHIYRAKINSKITQVFLLDKPVMQASFPNIKEGEMLKDKWLNVYSNAEKEIRFKTHKIINFKNSKFIGLCGRGTIAITGKVIKQSKNLVTLSNKDFYWNNKYKTAYLGKGKGYFVGNFSFLDTLNEWYSTDKYIYWYGKPPLKKRIRYRTENDQFILNQCKFITIKGLHFMGKLISFDNSSNCNLVNSEINYPTPFFDFEYSFDRGCNPVNDSSIYWRGKGVILNGKLNQIKSSIIQHSWGDGVTTFGTNNTVYNSIVRDCNWMGTDAAALNFYGTNHKVKHCYLSKTGRSVVLHSNSKNCKILFNEICEGGYLCDDLGLTYNYGTDGGGTEIAYNWLHHNRAPHYGSGIYLDNGNANFNVHNNVIWKCFVGLTLNETASNNRIYNNTFIKNKYTMGSAWFSEYEPKIVNVTTFNNITDSELKSRDQQPFYGTKQSNNLIIPHLSNFMINPYEFDFKINTEKLKIAKNTGAYAKTKSWKAGLINNENDHRKARSRFSDNLLKTLSYLILLTIFILIISKCKFYQIQNFNSFILFGIVTCSGFVYWLVYSIVFTNRETAEIFKHFDDANLLYINIFSSNPKAYFQFLVNGQTNTEIKELLVQTNYWYKNPSSFFDENHFLIKLHAWFLPISFGNIFSHLLLFSFIGLHGFIFIFKYLDKNIIQNFKSLFIIPSVWLISSSCTKDAIIFTSIASLIYILDKFQYKKTIFWLVFICSSFFLIELRSYIFISFIPFITIVFLEKGIKKQFNFLISFGIYLFFFIAILQIKEIDLFQTLKFKQNDLILVAKEMHASTYFKIDILNQPIDLLLNCFTGLYNSLLYPLIFSFETVELIYMSFENWIILLLIIYRLYYIFYKKQKINSNLFFFCILTLLFIGWTVPMSGVIIRLKAVILPFLLMSFISKGGQNS